MKRSLSFLFDRKWRKRGSVLIEYLAVLPVLVLLVWAGLQATLYLNTNSHVHEAAKNSVTKISFDLRGMEGKLTEIDPAIKEAILTSFYNESKRELSFNKFFTLYYNEDGTEITNEEAVALTILEDEAACETAMEDSDVKKVICIYTDITPSISGRSQEGIVVRLKAPYKVIGGFIPGLQDKIFVKATESEGKELTGRYQPFLNE